MTAATGSTPPLGPAALTTLLHWADAHDVRHTELDRVVRAIQDPDSTGRGPLRDPALLLPGLPGTPWHDPHRYPWVAALESGYPAIRAEFERQWAGDTLVAHPESVQLAETGRWSTYHFHDLGRSFPEHLAACPAVATALTRVPGSATAGLAYFSVMGPRTRVRPHCGFTNARLRCHLGLVVPPGCRMRVGTESRTWTEGRCLVFDDSYEHEVVNDSDRIRVVLLLDSWHPELSDTERRAIAVLLGHRRADARHEPAAATGGRTT